MEFKSQGPSERKWKLLQCRGFRVSGGKTFGVEPYPEGPCTQLLGTWDLGNSNYSTGFGEV